MNQPTWTLPHPDVGLLLLELAPFQLEALLLVAVAARRRGEDARELMATALRLGSRARLVRVFVDLGSEVARMVYEELETTKARALGLIDA